METTQPEFAVRVLIAVADDLQLLPSDLPAPNPDYFWSFTSPARSRFSDFLFQIAPFSNHSAYLSVHRPS